MEYLRPLHLPIFRNLLVADLVSDMGTFMQGVGAAWLMVSQGAGPLLVALTQTASAFLFFFSRCLQELWATSLIGGN